MTKSYESNKENKKTASHELSENELSSVAGGVMWNGKGEKPKKEPGKFYPAGSGGSSLPSGKHD